MDVESKVAVLETRMNYLEAETKKQTDMLTDQEKRMRRIEKVIYVALGVIATIEFVTRVALAMNHR